jgi:hypothetical protein
MQRRRSTATTQAPLQIPEARGFRAIDDSPARPAPLVVEGYYEDDSGRPPVKLSP